MKELLADLTERFDSAKRRKISYVLFGVDSLKRLLGILKRLDAAHDPKSAEYAHIHYIVTGKETKFHEATDSD
jgi:hypothetical protein